MLAASLIFLWGTVSLFKSASQNLIGRTSRPTPSEVTQTYKRAKMLASFEEFTEYTKGFMEALWNAIRVVFVLSIYKFHWQLGYIDPEPIYDYDMVILDRIYYNRDSAVMKGD